MDHPRFIKLREEEVKAIPLKQPCNYDAKKSLVSPTHPIHLSDVYVY
jgi:hypothetical protein